MLRRCLLALMLLTLTAQIAAAEDWARKMFATTSHDFGTVARGAKASFAFEITNLYEEDVEITGVRSSCGCTTATISKQHLKTWEKGAIVADFNTRSFLGHRSATITVTISKPFYAEVQLNVQGYIRSDVVVQPGAVQFGELEVGKGAEKKINVAYAGRSDWEIVDVRSANPNFEVEMSETHRGGGRVSYDLVVRLKPGAPAGFLNDQLILVTNDNRSPNVPVEVEGSIRSPLSVSPASLVIGVAEPGQQVTKQLVVRASQPFRILEVRCGDKQFSFKSDGEAKALHLIPVTFTAGDAAGKIAQSIEIVTDLGDGLTATCTATATVREAAATAAQ